MGKVWKDDNRDIWPSSFLAATWQTGLFSYNEHVSVSPLWNLPPHVCKAGSPPSLQARLPNNSTCHCTSVIFGLNNIMPRGTGRNVRAESSSDLLYLHNSHEQSRNTHNTGHYWWTAGWARSRRHRLGRWKGCGWCSAARLAPCMTLGAGISTKTKILLSKTKISLTTK